jgi:outer membrane protein assembly factor BamB/DNA-directed RNA polymerase subunit RPC12/RpoP
MLKTLHCPSCHASLDLPENLAQPTIKCPYCSTTVIVPEDLRETMSGTNANTEAVIQEIMQLIQNGQKIEAIKRYREAYRVDLKTAKDAVDALEVGWQVTTAVSGAYTSPTTIQVEGGRGCAGGLIALVILLFVLGTAAALFLFQVVPTQGDITEAISVISQEVSEINVAPVISSEQVNGPALLLPVGDGLTSDLAFVTRDYSTEMSYVNSLVGETGVRRWQSEGLAGEAGSVWLFASETALYYVAEDELTALDRENGRTLWRTTLSDRLPYTCNGCFLSFGDRLVVQTLDNHLVGLNATTGEQVWQLEPNVTSLPGLYRVESWFGLMTEDDNGDGGFDLLDPESGVLAKRLEPRCAHPSFPAQSPSNNDPVVIDESEKSLYFFFGFFDPQCIQRWNYETGTEVWNTAVEEDLPPIQAAFFQDSDQLYYNTANNQLFTVNKADGAVKLLLEDDGYDLIPLAARSKIVLVKAIRQQGSTREELWGVDAGDGRVLWKVVPQAEEEIGVFTSTNVVHQGDDGYWSSFLTLNG